MNIAIVIEQEFDPRAGGVQAVTNRLIAIFQTHGHDVILITIGKGAIPVAKLFLDGVQIEYFKVGKRKMASDINKIFAENNIQLCINQAGYSYSVTRQLLSIRDDALKIVNCLHINPLNFYDNHQEIIKNLLRSKNLQFLDRKVLHKIILAYHVLKQRRELGFIIKNTDAFVMLSESFRQELYHLVPAAKQFGHKIYGINNPFPPPALEVSALQKENVILHVGRLSHQQKRVDLLMEIWNKLHQELPDWEFWVVGHGPEEGYMKDFCRRQGLSRVKFFGKQQPDEYYQRAKIFHLTSAFEGFGNVLVEAQSYGCVPILFNSYSAAADIVDHGRNGMLVAPFHLEDYVQATLSLSHDRENLRQLSINASQNVKRFSYDSTYLKWEKVFRDLPQLGDYTAPGHER
jgi:glycosyltransferase involved in cell wall biosynthesis